MIPPARRSIRRRLAAGVVALVLLGAGTAAWQCWVRHPTLRRIEEAGRVRVGYAVESPYAFLGPDGRVTGESAETARLVAARLGWRIEWVQTSFEALIPELLDGRFDLIAAGLFVTPQRARLVRFAHPELRVGAGLLVRHGNPKRLHGVGDFKAPGVRAVVVAGSIEEQRLRELGLPQPVSVPDARAGALALESGLADALVLSLPTVRAIARSHPALQAVAASDPIAAALVAAAFRPADPALLAAWNRAQAQVLASSAHLRAIAAFGFTPQDVPAAPGRAPGTGS